MDVTANLSAAGNNIFMWLTFGVIIYAMVSYVLEKVSFEITSLIVLGLLLMLAYIGGLLGLEEQVKFNASDILAGFGNTALITIIALMVMAQGLFQSGAIETITNRLVTMASRSPFFAVLVILLIAMVSSAFLNNTPVVLMSIPILTAIAAQAGFAAPRLMMPLSFICILG
ncbi:MAG: SLC13 family permease, partial [Alphaproteobacteria bacterium]|nr:SLC13 family permease [Alphaproteobacteria bacterium]